MPLALDIGTIDIQDKEVVKFIQNRSIDEIKTMITDFLNREVKSTSIPSSHSKGKWAKVADEMRGTLSDDTVDYLQECSQEIRSGFEFRELK